MRHHRAAAARRAAPQPAGETAARCRAMTCPPRASQAEPTAAPPERSVRSCREQRLSQAVWLATAASAPPPRRSVHLTHFPLRLVRRRGSPVRPAKGSGGGGQPTFPRAAARPQPAAAASLGHTRAHHRGSRPGSRLCRPLALRTAPGMTTIPPHVTHSAISSDGPGRPAACGAVRCARLRSVPPSAGWTGSSGTSGRSGGGRLARADGEVRHETSPGHASLATSRGGDTSVDVRRYES